MFNYRWTFYPKVYAFFLMLCIRESKDQIFDSPHDSNWLYPFVLPLRVRGSYDSNSIESNFGGSTAGTFFLREYSSNKLCDTPSSLRPVSSRPRGALTPRMASPGTSSQDDTEDSLPTSLVRSRGERVPSASRVAESPSVTEDWKNLRPTDPLGVRLSFYDGPPLTTSSYTHLPFTVPRHSSRDSCSRLPRKLYIDVQLYDFVPLLLSVCCKVTLQFVLRY